MGNNSRVNRYDKSIFKKFWFWIVILGVLLILIFTVYSSNAKKLGNVSDKKSTSKTIKTNKNKTREETTKSKNTNNDSLNQNKSDKQVSNQQSNSSEVKKQVTSNVGNGKQNNTNSNNETNQNVGVNKQQTRNNDTSNNVSDKSSNQNDSNDDIKRNWVNDPSAQTYTKEQAQKIVSENNGSGEYNITPDNSNPEYMGNMNGTQTFGSMVTQHLYDAANGN